MNLDSMLALFTSVCLFHQEHRPVAANEPAINNVIEYAAIGSDSDKFCATSAGNWTLSDVDKLRCSLECMQKGSLCVGFNYLGEHNRTCNLFFYYPRGQFTASSLGCQYFQIVDNRRKNMNQLIESVNLALRKPTWLSGPNSLYGDQAVDGNTNMMAEMRGVDQVWTVDLGVGTDVGIVSVTAKRSENVFIGLTNTSAQTMIPTLSNVVVCANEPVVFGAMKTIFIQCAPDLQPARYVVVIGTDVRLFEVEVYGEN